MSTQMTPFDGMQLPAGLMSQDLLNLNKNITGGLGSSINRISIKGARFRLNVAGQEKVLNSLQADFVIVNAIPHISRSFNKDKYVEGGDNKPPTCRSRDGVKPDADIVGEDRQSEACVSCKNNIKGSADDGKSRACAFKKRIVVIDPADLQEGVIPVPFAFDVNATTIFGEDKPSENKYSLQSFFKVLSTPRPNMPSGIPVQCLVTRMEFDSNSSVPKLLLSPSPGGPGYGSFLTGDQIKKVVAFAKTEEVTRLLNEELSTAAATTEPAQTASPPAQQSIAAPKKTWQEIGKDAGLDDDDIEMMEGLGGPFTEAGAKRWAKMKGPSLGNDTPVAAAPAPSPAAPPPPPPKTPWKDAAKAAGMDDDDIGVCEDLGGPGTEKGLKFWTKNGGGDLADIDVSVKVANKGGRPKKNSDPAPPETSPPAVQSAPATIDVKPTTVTQPLNSGAATKLAAALTTFDD